MARILAVVICAVLLALVMSPWDAVAQQKTTKACREEWRANKTANQARGVTEKAYVAQCRNGETTVGHPGSPPVPSEATGRNNRRISEQKTVKECRDEWRANRTANQASGLTERAYVDRCRSGGTAAEQTTAPAEPPVAALPPSEATGRNNRRISEQKTVKECRDEWRANRAANQASGVTERAYVDRCRSGGTAAERTTAPAASPVAAPSPSETPPPIPTATAPAERPAPPPTRRPAPEAVVGNEFSSEAEAKAHCPSDTVVWASLRSKIYPFSGTRYYGTTEYGAYMCEGDSTTAGMRAAKRERHP
jgi:hypothetical protein